MSGRCSNPPRVMGPTCSADFPGVGRSPPRPSSPGKGVCQWRFELAAFSQLLVYGLGGKQGAMGPVPRDHKSRLFLANAWRSLGEGKTRVNTVCGNEKNWVHCLPDAQAEESRFPSDVFLRLLF